MLNAKILLLFPFSICYTQGETTVERNRMKEIIFSSATEIAAAIRSRRVSAVEVLEAHLNQIKKYNGALNAVVTIDEKEAFQRARQADEALANDEYWGPLHGVPMTLKDGLSTAGMRTTAGFPPLADYVPTADSTVAARLKTAGAIIFGKTNVPVMLADRQSNNPIFGRTNNPWNLERTPGGSSGGAGAALASGMTPLEIGSDLGGSVRTPAQFCGIFALKPTEHRVSLHGHIPGLPDSTRLMRIIATIGPMARTVDDLILAFQIIAGADGHDIEVPPVPLKPIPELSLKDIRVAWAASFPRYPVAKQIQTAVEKLAGELQPLCLSVSETLPEIDFWSEHIAFEEIVSSILSVADPGADRTKLALQSVEDYLTALHKRDHSIQIWEQFFEEWDVLLCPVSMMTAFPHCEPGAPLTVDGELVPYPLGNSYCKIFNYTGHPAIVLPYERDTEGLPIGVMIVGKRWDDEKLLAIAKVVSEVTEGFQRPSGY
jgi:amidase